MRCRNILAVTGIRSEYYLQRPVFQSIADHPDLNIDLIVTGAHLSPGGTESLNEINSDGFNIIDRVESLLYSDSASSRIKSASIQLQQLTHIVDHRRPDWILVTGDREEAFNLSLCGAYMNTPVAHYSAGDRVVGNVDDMVRHAISRLAHLLLTTSEDSKCRLLKTGEQEFRVHNVGHSGIDRFRTTACLDKIALAHSLGVERIHDTYLVVSQHPISSQIDKSGAQIRETLLAVQTTGIQAFVIHPNSDPGSHEIIRIFEEFKETPNIHFFNTIPDIPFVNLLRNASMLVGNSSLGILEAPYLKLPVVNVGARQKGRYHSGNVVFVRHDRDEIQGQINKFVNDENAIKIAKDCYNPFGTGDTGFRIAQLLATTDVDESFMNKDLTY